jgi:xylan 1,4-beta-xylosidase
MFVYREQGGYPIYNWQYIDDLFDRMLSIGIRPFVELTFFPKQIALDESTFAWWGGHGTPPKDFTGWTKLIEQFIRHCRSRYGVEEVRTWYFEIWNEPNLKGFWNGTQQQFFEMYKAVSKMVKGVDPELRIGGPATSSFHPDEETYRRLASKKEITAKDYIGVISKGPWIEDFLAYCENESLPLDFVSTHPYPTSYPIDSEGNSLEVSRPVTSTREDILWVRNAMSKTRYAGAEIHLTEWSSSPSTNDYAHDFPQEATYIVKVNLDCIGLANSLSYWTFTDIFEEAGGAPSIFTGCFGLLNFQGIAKPSFHAYRFLNLLGDTELLRRDGCIVTRSGSSGAIASVFYNYPTEVLSAPPISKANPKIAEETLGTGQRLECRLELSGLAAGANFRVETLDGQHGFAYRAWLQMGRPDPPDREQTEVLKKLGDATEKASLRASPDGKLTWSAKLEPWAVVAIYQE